MGRMTWEVWSPMAATPEKVREALSQGAHAVLEAEARVTAALQILEEGRDFRASEDLWDAINQAIPQLEWAALFLGSIE